MVEMMRINQLNQAAQLEHNIKLDARIETLLKALTMSHSRTLVPQHTAQNNQESAYGNATQQLSSTHEQISTDNSSPRVMDTEHVKSYITNSVQRPMDTDNVSEQAHTSAATAQKRLYQHLQISLTTRTTTMTTRAGK